ncbi:UNVERIFIED_CONTAM: hypothetical protein FKN15_042992 [Acipenser sinensis]
MCSLPTVFIYQYSVCITVHASYCKSEAIAILAVASNKEVRGGVKGKKRNKCQVTPQTEL